MSSPEAGPLFPSDETLIKLQAASGLAFGSFLSLHLVNLVFAHTGPAGYDGVMEVFRQYYQNPLVEPVIIGGAVVVHQISSAIRIKRRWKRNFGAADLPLHLKLHRYSGYVLGALIGGHVLAVRFGSFFHLEEKAHFGVLTMSLRGTPLLYYPYYAVFACSGLYHMLYGTNQSTGLFFNVRPFQNKRVLYAVASLGSLAIASSILALGGVYFKVTNVPKSIWLRDFALRVLPSPLASLL